MNATLKGKTLFITGASRGIDLAKCRMPEILADAAYLILTSDPTQITGNFFIDETLLRQHGVSDFGRYSVTPGNADLIPDLFVE